MTESGASLTVSTVITWATVTAKVAPRIGNKMLQSGVCQYGIDANPAGLASIPYWQTPDWSILFPILGATLAVTVAHVMTVLTVRLAPLSVTSPGRYSIIIFGAISAFIILQEVPSTGTIIGSIIVIVSGLILLGLEKQKS